MKKRYTGFIASTFVLFFVTSLCLRGDILLPPSGDNVTCVGESEFRLLECDGGGIMRFVAPSGGGTPGGVDTQVQFNNSGAFGGSAEFTFDDSTDQLLINALGATSPLLIQEGGSKRFEHFANGNWRSTHQSGTVTLTASSSSARINFASSGDLLLSSVGASLELEATRIVMNSNIDFECTGDGLCDIGDGAGGNNRFGNVFLTNSFNVANGTILSEGSLDLQAPDNANTSTQEIFDSVTTTDDTLTTTATLALNDDTVYQCTTRVSGRRTDSTDRAGYVRHITVFREGAGSCTVVGSASDAHTAESDGTWDIDPACSGNNFIVQVLGAIGKTVNWATTVKCLEET